MNTENNAYHEQIEAKAEELARLAGVKDTNFSARTPNRRDALRTGLIFTAERMLDRGKFQGPAREQAEDLLAELELLLAEV